MIETLLLHIVRESLASHWMHEVLVHGLYEFHWDGVGLSR